MMSLSNLLVNFWRYTLQSASLTLNKCPAKSVEKTPHELYFGKFSKLAFLGIWGGKTYVKKLTKDKLQPKSDKCYFIGYPKETVGYYSYLKHDDKIFVARSRAFLEKEYLSRRGRSEGVHLEETQDVEATVNTPSVETTDTPQELVSSYIEDPVLAVVEKPTLRRSNRDRQESDRWYGEAFMIENDEPTSYEEAMSNKDVDKLLIAMKSIRIILPIVAFHDYEIWQMDVKTGFLNGNLEEDVYMVQPPGFICPKGPKKVCKLQRYIYGLKQASRN
ncbi:hypothetical protein LIER_39918 [Lithospermum erythrorhizon]|uniref:Reverse transcriptase Ty1/copia-type domain-containing protein n=1 Tax=Lithospermum erythrorhizon TaxID=34254 RepID=A0AAV3QM29_LITER